MSAAESKLTNILVCGIGGQGVMTAGEVLAEAAMSLGFDVKKTEVAGMAQRGGVVTSHLRFGPRVLGPAIPAGEADILVGFEAAEALRWCHQLRPGAPAMVNTMSIGAPVISAGMFRYPDDPVAAIRARGVPLVAFDAEGMARGLGDVRMVNTVMLGAIADRLPFPPEVLEESVLARFRARKPHLEDANAAAFAAGRRAFAEAALQADAAGA